MMTKLYIPPYFSETDQNEIATIIENYPLAHLVAYSCDGLSSTPLPLFMSKANTLIGHIASANPFHENLNDGQDVLAIFSGEDAYISANYYPTKAVTHKFAPTWNYQIVHVHGRIFFHHDEATKRMAVAKLTHLMETKTNGAKAWKMSDAPKDYLNELLQKIIAFHIDITRIEAKSKLSQDKSEIDRENVKVILSKGIAPDLASKM